HAFLRVQTPHSIHLFGNFNPAPPIPLILRARHDYIGVIKKKFETQSLVSNRASAPYDHEIDVTIARFAMQRLDISGHEMEYDARIAPSEPIDESRNEACGQKGGASDPHFPNRRVGEK